MNLAKKATESKTFCSYPWIHQYVGPDGEVKPCCLFSPNEDGIGNIKENSLKEIWNNDKTKQMRLDMLNGVEISGCTVCNNRAGLIKTHREEANLLWFNKNTMDIINNTNVDGSLPEHNLKYIDARFNNLCNLKCRTCTPYFSTSWHEDYDKLRNPNEASKYPKSLLVPGNTESQLLDEILPQLPNVNRIYFAGGEPLMQADHYKVLEELIRLGHTGTPSNPLVIQYSTNFSNLTLGKTNIIDLWKKFSKIIVNASLDASHSRAEYWRKNTDWETIVKNREDLKKECPHIEFTIGSTLSWINAFNLVDFHKEWTGLKYININSIFVNVLDGPECYSLKYIPNWKKKKIELVYRNHVDWLIENRANKRTINEFLNVITFMNSVQTGDDFLQANTFKDVTSKLDKVRNENFWDIFPEHDDMKELMYGSNSL
jgi:radical SAM protein with 4Fe4S-binding SPASM domain